MHTDRLSKIIKRSSPDINETLIDLIRHGEPEGGSLYRGHKIDDPLSQLGWQQMRSATGEHAPWNQIITSPMSRCHDFATELGDQHNIPVTVMDNFKEVGFGNWEGKTREQLKAERLQEYEAFYRDPVSNRPERAEALQDFIQRVTDTYQSVIENFSGQHLLIVAHAGVIRAIIAHTLLSPPHGMYRIQVDNAGISRISHKEDKGILLKHNVTMDEFQ